MGRLKETSLAISTPPVGHLDQAMWSSGLGWCKERCFMAITNCSEPNCLIIGMFRGLITLIRGSQLHVRDSVNGNNVELD